MHRSASLLPLILTGLLPLAATSQESQSIDEPRRIAAAESLWTEELTWQEVRDAINSGTTTIIIGTGGIDHKRC